MATIQLDDPDGDGILEFTQTIEDIDGDSISVTLELDKINGSEVSGSDRDPSWLSWSKDSTISSGTRVVDVNVEISAGDLGPAGTVYTFEIIADDGIAEVTKTFTLEVFSPSQTESKVYIEESGGGSIDEYDPDGSLITDPARNIVGNFAVLQGGGKSGRWIWVDQDAGQVEIVESGTNNSIATFSMPAPPNPDERVIGRGGPDLDKVAILNGDFDIELFDLANATRLFTSSVTWWGGQIVPYKKSNGDIAVATMNANTAELQFIGSSGQFNTYETNATDLEGLGYDRINKNFYYCGTNNSLSDQEAVYKLSRDLQTDNLIFNRASPGMGLLGVMGEDNLVAIAGVDNSDSLTYMDLDGNLINTNTSLTTSNTPVIIDVTNGGFIYTSDGSGIVKIDSSDDSEVWRESGVSLGVVMNG